MPSQLITMKGVGSGGTENAIANIDIPQDGTIVGVQVSHSSALTASGDTSTGSLSFIATNQIGINDSRAELVITQLKQMFTTSGGGNMSTNFFVPMDVPVAGGERLYMHIVATASRGTDLNFIVHFDPRGGLPRRRSARR